ncbi:hypothetical protein BDW71DRAFT_206660 [Aspergillus fruticulosus]
MSMATALPNELIDETLHHLPTYQLLGPDANLRTRCKGLILSRIMAQDFYLLAMPRRCGTRLGQFGLAAPVAWIGPALVPPGQAVPRLPAGELIVDRLPQRPIRGFLPGRPDYAFLAAMGRKHDALATVLTRHSPGQEPAWALSDRTALVMLSRAPVHLGRPASGNAAYEPTFDYGHPLGQVRLAERLLQRGLNPLRYFPNRWTVLAHAIWCRHDEIFQRVAQWLPAGELIIDRPTQLPIHGVLPGARGYAFLAVMGRKHDARATLLTRHSNMLAVYCLAPRRKRPRASICEWLLRVLTNQRFGEAAQAPPLSFPPLAEILISVAPEPATGIPEARMSYMRTYTYDYEELNLELYSWES